MICQINCRAWVRRVHF